MSTLILGVSIALFLIVSFIGFVIVKNPIEVYKITVIVLFLPIILVAMFIYNLFFNKEIQEYKKKLMEFKRSHDG